VDFLKYVWKNNRPVFVSSTIILLLIISICLTPIYGNSLGILMLLIVVVAAIYFLFSLVQVIYNDFRKIYTQYKQQQLDDASLIIRKLKGK
jgi:c-di-AMP phosphodiesterase-like protein